MAEFRTPGLMQEVSTPSPDAQFVMATAVGVKDELITQQNLIEFVNTSGAVVSVKDHGALGDGVTDDTASIEAAAAALKAIGGGTLFFPHGTYVVAAMDLVNMNNCLIDLGGSTLTTTDANTTWLVRLRTSNNCKVINGVFEGNRQGRALSSPLGGVNPHNLFVRGGSNIVIENVESNNAVGDGFYVVGEVTDNNTTHPNIDFISCHAATNYRQGLSFIEWTTANVVGGSFNGQTGGDPQSGIDIEPNNASALIDGALVYVSGAEFKSNVHRGILTSGTPASGSINLVVSGCVFSGNANNAIETVHDLVVSDCVFVDCNGADVAAIKQNSGTGTATKTIVTGCQFTDCDQYAVRTTTDKTTVISDCIVRNSKGLVAADNGNLVVSGCIVESPTTTAITLSQTVGNTSVTGCVFESTQNYVLFVNTPGYVNVTGCTFTGDNAEVIRCVRGNVNAQSNLFGSAGLALYMDEAGDTSILANNRMEGMDNPYFSAAAGEVVTFSNVVDGVATQVSNSVQAYGAVGDGVADDAPAFQAAILAEDVVLVPAGTYRLATNLALTSAHDNTSIQMEDGAVLKTDVGQVINLNGCTDVSITGGALDGQTATRIGIWAINCTGLKISGTKVHDLSSTTDNTIGIIIDGDATRCTIENCHIVDVLSPTDESSRGILFSGAGTVSQAIVTGNRVEGIGPRNDGDALVVQDYLADDVDILITNNYLSAAKRGLKLQQGGQTVVGNVIEAKIVVLGDSPPIAPITMQGSNVLLANNTVRSPNGCSDANILLGFGLDNVKIVDNLFTNANTDANANMDHIQLSGVSGNFNNVEVRGNSFSGYARYAFNAADRQCTNFSVKDNLFYGTVASTAFQLGSQPAGSSNIDIAGNIIETAASMVVASGDVANGYSLTSNRLAGQYQTNYRSIVSTGGGGSDESWFEAVASATQPLDYENHRRISVTVTGPAAQTLTLTVNNPGSDAATDLGDYDLMLKNDSSTGEKTVDFSALGLGTVPTFTQLKGDVTLVKLFWTGSKWLLR